MEKKLLYKINYANITMELINISVSQLSQIIIFIIVIAVAMALLIISNFNTTRAKIKNIQINRH